MKSLKIIPLLFFLLLLGCEDGLNCIIPRGPELPNKSIPIATTESYYYIELKAEINNEPRDNDYDYYFDVDGLPVGMDYYVNYRTISIEGTPLLSGTYDFTVFLDVDGPFRDFVDEDPDLLCDYSTQKTYTLIVE